MKKLFTIALALFFNAAFINAQDSYVTAGSGYVAEDILPTQNMFSTFDIAGNHLYGHDGDTIHKLDMETGETLAKYGKPAGYASYPSFLYVDEAKNEMWAGFTVSGNANDRIYRIDLTTGTWTHEATLAGNFDLVNLNGYLLVSGTVYGTPNNIFLLDTTGNNNHRVIIETTGNSAGISLDQFGNLYYATSLGENDKLVRWSYWNLISVIEDSTATPLQLDNAIKLSNLPAGAYDCSVDDTNNVFITINALTSDKVLARWNGTYFDNLNYDTVATTNGDYDWFTMVKTKGNALNPGDENGVYTLSYAHPIVKANGDNYSPILVEPFETIQTSIETEYLFVNLDGHFTDPDDPDSFTYWAYSSEDGTVLANVLNGELELYFYNTGQATITVIATNAERSVSTEFVVGVYPEITGDYTVADFEDLGLPTNSYWNGSNGEGQFTSGNAVFKNSYSPDYGSWSDWAYTNMADDSTTGYANQFSAIAAQGFDPIVSEGSTYGVSYPSSWGATTIKFDDNKAHTVKGFYTTNSTYAALAMKNGDAFSKKFGGESGYDPDWFKLSIWGHHNGTQTDTIEYYLADFRFNNHENDYIIETWQWIELTSLGYVDSLQMSLSSSDNGQWGMNTPNYYCADNFYVGAAEVGITESAESANVNVYPNPTQSQVKLQSGSNKSYNVSIVDYTGKVIRQLTNISNGQNIDLSEQAPGLYILQLYAGNKIITKRIIKQ